MKLIYKLKKITLYDKFRNNIMSLNSKKTFLKICTFLIVNIKQKIDELNEYVEINLHSS